jgi:hypothetical protein
MMNHKERRRYNVKDLRPAEPLQATPDEFELWQSAIPGSIVIRKFNQQGILSEENVPAGRKIQLTPKERRINQELCASDDLDVFQNGMLTPVRLLDSEPETETLKANSNAMSETHMRALFKSQLPTFTKKINEVSNVITLRRLLEVAEEVDASLRQVKVINERIAEMSPNVGESSTVGR